MYVEIKLARTLLLPDYSIESKRSTLALNTMSFGTVRLPQVYFWIMGVGLPGLMITLAIGRKYPIH